MRLEPRCPSCGWRLRFVPYSVAFPRNELDLWQGYCWNPDPKACDFESHVSSGPLRVVDPSDAV